MSSTQLRRGADNITLCTNYFEVIVKVWKGCFQTGTHPKPGFLVDRFGTETAELKIIREHGLYALEITLLDGIHHGLYDLSFIQNVFSFTASRTIALLQMGLGVNEYSLWNILLFPQNDKHNVYVMP